MYMYVDWKEVIWFHCSDYMAGVFLFPDEKMAETHILHDLSCHGRSKSSATLLQAVLSAVSMLHAHWIFYWYVFR